MNFKIYLRTKVSQIKNQKLKYFLLSTLFWIHPRYNEYAQELERLKKMGKDKIPIRLNVYGHTGSISSFYKKQNKIHNFLKSKIIVPLLDLAETFMKKYLVKNRSEIPNMPQFKNLKLFDVAFERTSLKWNEFFRMNIHNQSKTPKQILNSHKNFNRYLKIMRKAYLTVNVNDTAYLEFHNMLMYEIAIIMNEMYKNKCPEHILYTDKSINDIKYFAVQGDIPIEFKGLVDLILTTGNVYLHQLQFHPVTMDHFHELFGPVEDLINIPELSLNPLTVKYSENNKLRLTDIARYHRN